MSQKVLLNNIAFPDQHMLSGYESRGGYQAIRKALNGDPLSIVEEVKKSGLRGRGGAGFPTGQKWSFVPRNSGKPTYLICNADESEPGTFKDRLLLEKEPHLVLEGMIIAAFALGSNFAFMYVRGEYAFPYERFNDAVKDAYKKGYLGKNIFGSNFNLEFTVHRGAGAYICGEETALINSLEGKKGQPRIKPPFPAIAGLYKSPTVVNNVETLAALPWILNNGGESYSKIGTEKSPGTKLISASGHINKPGVYEIELGTSLKSFLENECGGVWKNRKLKAIIPGGSSVPILKADKIDNINMDYESLRDAGTMLGSGGFIVMDETTDMKAVVHNLSHFYAHESCGQCTPCREGGHWIEKIYKRWTKNESLPGDDMLIESLCKQIAGHTICPFGDALATPATGILRAFREEF